MKQKKCNCKKDSEPCNEMRYFDALEFYLKSLNKGERLKVIFYDRVSYRNQEANGNLEDRLTSVQKRYGKKLEIVKYFSEVADSRSNSLKDRHELKKALNWAMKTKLMVVVTPSVDRIIRPKTYSKENQFAPLLMRDIRFWEDFNADGVIVIALIEPGTDKKIVRGRLASMGQEGKDRYGGRPGKKSPGYKKRLRKRFLREARRLHDEKGFPLREISLAFKLKYSVRISYRTICDWLNRDDSDNGFAVAVGG